MRLAIGLVVAAAAGGTEADLYAVRENGKSYYIISTEDASVTPISPRPEFTPLEIAVGPDGYVYGVTSYYLLRVWPSTGEYEGLLDFGDTMSSGGLAISADGIAYASAWGPIPGYGMWRWNVSTDVFAGGVGFARPFYPLAMHFRDDGVLLGMAYQDSTVYEIDPASGDFEPIGSVDPSIGSALSFARDGDETYVLAGTYFGATSLYEVDPYTFETTLVGEVPGGMWLTGISGIPCAADFNRDAVLNVLDFVALQLAWQAGDDSADVNGDGALNVLDFVAFQVLFQEGCG